VVLLRGRVGRRTRRPYRSKDGFGASRPALEFVPGYRLPVPGLRSLYLPLRSGGGAVVRRLPEAAHELFGPRGCLVEHCRWRDLERTPVDPRRAAGCFAPSVVPADHFRIRRNEALYGDEVVGARSMGVVKGVLHLAVRRKGYGKIVFDRRLCARRVNDTASSWRQPPLLVLLDSIGPRLTGSPANRAANDWLLRIGPGRPAGSRR
jgi:hypothetical protein